MSLLIYSDSTSVRLEYILDFIFGRVIPCEYKLTHDFEELINFDGAKINYSKEQPYTKLINIIPMGMLAKEELCDNYLALFQWDDLPAIFETSSEKIPFDIFSASFFLVTRYEEYQNNKQDEFQRFPHTESIAYKNNFLDKPLIDLWTLRLKEVLLSSFPNLEFQEKEFKFIPTYDIDIAYSYKHKGVLRNLGGALKDLSKGNFKAVKTRIHVLQNTKEDPFDSYHFLDELHKEFKLSPIYFFLLGSGSKLDKNIPISNPHFQKLIKQIASNYEVGIHPSFRSNHTPDDLMLEIDSLNSITGKETTKSRQHYIKFELPYTYRGLIFEDIKEDYSMGYGSINGFRASTSNPFYWFDLEKNEVTDLKVFPFCFMECNSFFEQKQTIEETEKEIENFINEVKRVNGTFISIWHNFSLGSDPLWKDWSKLYEQQIRQIQQK